jgi:hypothetical protein
MKQQFLYQKTGTIRLSVYQDNRPIVPTSAKITLYKPGSTSELQAQDTASIDGTTGEMTYSITVTHTASYDLNYKAVWEYVYNGITYYETQLFDVVKSMLSIPITDDDIYVECEQIRNINVQEQGTATAGAGGTITDTLNRKESDNYWKGGKVEILSGTGAGQVRDITSFIQSTSVISVTPNWGTNPDTTSIYRVIKSFASKTEQCFEDVETSLYNKGKRDSLILESSQIKYPLLFLVIHKICQDMISEKEDKWEMLSDKYWKKYENAFSNMVLEYDEDESGGIAGDEEADQITSPRIGRC